MLSSAQQIVRLVRSPLKALLLGPRGSVPLTRNITLDASKSSDPDSAAANLKFDFACEPQPCFSDPLYTGAPLFW
jgi:hypothetical protein